MNFIGIANLLFVIFSQLNLEETDDGCIYGTSWVINVCVINFKAFYKDISLISLNPYSINEQIRDNIKG